MKRLLSLILVVVMLLLLLPTGALATEFEPVTETTLMMHVEMMDMEGEWTEFPLYSWNPSIYDRWEAGFYLHHPDGSVVQLNPEDLELPDLVHLEEINENGWCWLLNGSWQATHTVTGNGLSEITN